MNSLLLRLSLAFAAAGFFGCFTADNRTAGVDDFPNSIYAQVTGFIGQSQQAGVLQPVPADAQGFIQSGAVPSAKPAAGKMALGKPMETDTVITIDTSTESLGYVTYMNTVTDSLKITYDTARIRWDSQAQDTIKNNENIIFLISTADWFSGKIDRVAITDADGDGIINAVAGRACKAELQITEADSGMLSQAELVLGPRPDSNFATHPDTLIYLAQWWKTRGADTLATAAYSSADSDSVIIDDAAVSLVWLDYRELQPADKPGVAENRMRLKMRLHYQAANEVLGISGRQILTNGRVNDFALTNTQGGADLNLQDTVIARFTVTGAPNDTLDSSVTVARMNLGGNFNPSDDDSTYAFDITVVNRVGDERRGEFQFTSDKPIPSGAKPQSGSVSLSLQYSDNTSLTLTGTLKSGALTADVTDRNGKRFHAAWDANGNLLSVTAP